MPKSKYSKKRWRLTQVGQDKLKHALSHLPNACVTNTSWVAKALNLNRETAARIVDNTWQGNKKTIEDAFSNVGLDLEDKDCEEVIDDNPSQKYTNKSNKTYEITQKESIETSFKTALLKLNYLNQSQLFEKFWYLDSNPQIGAFLIGGQRGSGQRWLVNRLVREFRLDVTTAKKFFISLPDNREVYIDDLWSRFRETLRLSPTASVGDIANYLYNCWQDGTVILIFENLDQLYETEPKKILQEFWRKLVAMVRDNPKSCESYFLMFLVDNCALSKNWAINPVTLEQWQPDKIVDLKTIENFSELTIKNWLREHQTILSRLLPEPLEIQSLTQRLFQRSNQGIPELVMEDICKRCGCDWNNIY